VAATQAVNLYIIPASKLNLRICIYPNSGSKSVLLEYVNSNYATSTLTRSTTLLNVNVPEETMVSTLHRTSPFMAVEDPIPTSTSNLQFTPKPQSYSHSQPSPLFQLSSFSTPSDAPSTSFEPSKGPGEPGTGSAGLV
jgi:hypothetical protein